MVIQTITRIFIHLNKNEKKFKLTYDFHLKFCHHMSGQLRFQRFGNWISMMFLQRQLFTKNKSNTSTSPLVPVQNKILATNTQKQLYAMYSSCIVISSVDTILFTNRAILEITREFVGFWKGIWTHYLVVVDDNSYAKVVRKTPKSSSHLPPHTRGAFEP